MIKKTFLLQIWLLLLIFFGCWQDFFVVNHIGEIGRSPIFLLVPIYLLFEIAYYKKRKPTVNVVSVIFTCFTICYLAISTIYIALWVTNDRELIVLGENIIIKTIKIITYYVCLILFFRHVSLLYLLINDEWKVIKAFYLMLVIHFILLLIELKTRPHALPLFHSNSTEYLRIRLLTMESSWTGGIAIMLTSVSLLGLRRYRTSLRRFFYILPIFLFFTIYSFASSSKQFFTVFCLSIVIVLLSTFSLKKKYFYLYIGIFVGFIFTTFYYIFPYLKREYVTDFDKFTSFTTRASSFLSSFYVTLKNPLGTGGLYQTYFINNLGIVANYLVNFFGGGNISEIVGMLQSNSDKTIAVHSELGMWAILIGIPGIVLFFILYYYLLRKSRPFIPLYFGMLYFLITGILSESIMNKPTAPLFWSVILFIYYKNHSKEKN